MLTALLAVWVVEGRSIRMVKPSHPRVSRGYVPEHMPPAEVGGCHFEEPKSDTWRQQHRSVSFAGAGHPFAPEGA